MEPPTLVELEKRITQAESLLRRAVEMRAAQRYYYRTRRDDALENAKNLEREFEIHSEQYAKTWPLFQMRLPL